MPVTKNSTTSQPVATNISYSDQFGVPRTPSLHALFTLGFRPLYPLGMAWSAIVVAAWVFAPGINHAPLFGPWWHAHEMVWGFAATIAVGFLFTAVPNWTDLPTADGLPLALLVAVWLLARIGLWLGGRWFAAAAALDVAFFAGAAVFCLRPILRARNARNLWAPAMLLALAAADALFLHAAAGGALSTVIRMEHVGLLLMAVVSVLVGRRVIPFFATRAIPELTLSREVVTGLLNLALLLPAVGCDALHTAPHAEGALLLASCLILLWQIGRWKPWRVLGRPLLWILYLGYAGLAAGLGARAGQLLGAPLADSFWIHLLAVCGFSVLIIGMVTRTSLGHLGRPLRLDGWSLTSYALLLASAAMRLLSFVPQVSLATIALHAAAIAWGLACAVFVGRYGPWMVRPRNGTRGLVALRH